MDPRQDFCLENPRQPYGQRRLEGYVPWHCWESHMTEQGTFLSLSLFNYKPPNPSLPPPPPTWQPQVCSPPLCVCFCFVNKFLHVMFWFHAKVIYMWKSKSLCHVWLSVTPWTVAQNVLLPWRCSRQEYWRVLPFPSPGDHPDPGDRMGLSCIVGRFITVWMNHGFYLHWNERWTIRKAEHQRIDAFELGCWERSLIPW